MPSDLSPDAWAHIRYEYEHTARPIPDICAEHGISSGTLRDRMRRWRWTRRRPPIPAEGPPALPPAVPDPWMPAAPPSAPTLPFPALAAARPERPRSGEAASEEGELERGDAPVTASLAALDSGEGMNDEAEPAAPSSAAVPAVGSGETMPADEPAMILPRLQSAVARVLPAIEAMVARLGAGVTHPRELERMGRALGTLTRTLRELNALLADHQSRAAACQCDCDMPEDIDAFRLELARRIDAFVDSRTGKSVDGAAPQAP